MAGHVGYFWGAPSGAPSDPVVLMVLSISFCTWCCAHGFAHGYDIIYTHLKCFLPGFSPVAELLNGPLKTNKKHRRDNNTKWKEIHMVMNFLVRCSCLSFAYTLED